MNKKGNKLKAKPRAGSAQLDLLGQFLELPLPKTRYDAVVYFLAKMDTEMLDEILDSKKTYQDFKKEVFLQKLNNAFDVFRDSGLTQLQIYPGVCKGCSKGCRGFTFLGKRGQYIDIIFKKLKEEIMDMYECSALNNDGIVPDKSERVWIDGSLFEIEPEDLLF